MNSDSSNSLSVVTLNIEGNRHFERWIPVISGTAPDVLCLQEVFECDLEFLGGALGYRVEDIGFLPMTTVSQETKYNIPLRGTWGIAMFSKVPHTPYEKIYYNGSGTTPVFSAPNSVDRGLLWSVHTTPTGASIPLATTHFTWTAKGEASTEQHTDFLALKQRVATLPPHILCGDFNSPRGGELFAKFETLYTDGLPADITTTIDGSLHYAGNLELVVDTVFYQPPLKPVVQEVLAGVSDHKGIWFLVNADTQQQNQ